MSMLPFHTTLLLVSVRAGNSMENANGLKIFVKVAVFAPPISLNRFYLSIEETFNHGLKMEKNLHDIRFGLNRENPSKTTKSIHKREIKTIAIY
jgi:hypothetical protein